MSDAAFAQLIRAARRRPLWEARASTRETAIGREGLECVLQHRGPMLMLDAITAIDLEQRALRATRHLGLDDPGFVGHFPGEPVYPAFLQIEIGAQAGVCLLDFLRRHSVDVPAGLRPRGVRPIKVQHGVLLAEIHPGDSLTVLATVLADDELTSVFAAQALRGDTVCSTAIVEVCFVDP